MLVQSFSNRMLWRTSNPLAGTDSTLLALSGAGHMGGKLFGFASCPRAVGAAEGMNVLAERRVPVPPEQGAQPRGCNILPAALSGLLELSLLVCIADVPVL